MAIYARVRDLKLYEEGNESNIAEDRKFTTYFPQSISRYIYWQLFLDVGKPQDGDNKIAEREFTIGLYKF
jgi:hypothetical protein